ncbi:hypothetical protein [Shewanella woodyi]|uniref:hypothetical protein n=1 Tax=Shewanella woodyi TaxID=60961 RepID=UPI003747EF0E
MLVMDANSNTKKPRNFSAYLVLILAGALSYYIYLTYQKDLETQINIDYFRQLSEAEDSLNMQLSRIKALKKRDDELALRSQFNTYKESKGEIECKATNSEQSNHKSQVGQPLSQAVNIGNGKISINSGPEEPLIKNSGSKEETGVLLSISSNNRVCITSSKDQDTHVALNELLQQIESNFDDLLLAKGKDQILASANSYGTHNIIGLSNLIKQQQENHKTNSLDSLFSRAPKNQKKKITQ